jgi:hypothetical protein
MKKTQIVIYGPPQSGKSHLGIELMCRGQAVFDSDFIYAIYHNEYPMLVNVDTDPQEKWDKVFTLFKQLYERDALSGYDYVITADRRICEYLKSKGWYNRNMSKRLTQILEETNYGEAN